MNKKEGGVRLQGIVRESKSGTPLVSVITVVYNGAKHLEDTIRSVLQQDYRNIEYIIIDGGSTDSTLDIIQKHEASVDYWLSEQDHGIYDAMNKGVALARGELINFLNSDDSFEPDAVRHMVGAFLKYGSKHIYFGNNYLIDELAMLKTKVSPKTSLDCGMPFCHQTMFLSSEAYGQMCGYDTSYRNASDYDFVLRLVEKGYKLLPVDAMIVNFRLYGTTSRTYFYQWYETGKVIVMHFGIRPIKMLRLLCVFTADLFKVTLKKGLLAFFGRELAGCIIFRLMTLRGSEAMRIVNP